MGKKVDKREIIRSVQSIVKISHQLTIIEQRKKEGRSGHCFGDRNIKLTLPKTPLLLGDFDSVNILQPPWIVRILQGQSGYQSPIMTLPKKQKRVLQRDNYGST